MTDPMGAFVQLFDEPLRTRQTGSLAGLQCGVKDLFDIAGYVTGAGNPDWASDQSPADESAPAVRRLLNAGAAVIGKTHTDELAFSLNGENAHYGTPVNAAAPERVPGGSSSGSAAAVAGKVVDFAIGTDTGGSVRLPASYCGIWGMRPTHGSVSVDGLVALAPSFDTVGWFARDPETLAAVSHVLLSPERASGLVASGTDATTVLWPRDAFELLDRPIAGILADRLCSQLPAGSTVREIELSDEAAGLAGWLKTFQTLQWYEAWAVHGDWITRRRPRFGPGIAERFAGAATVTRKAYEAALENRQGVAERLDSIFAGPKPTVLALPVAPGPAPAKNLPQETLNDFRKVALTCLCPAGLAGFPEISIPGALADGLPVGLGLAAARGADRSLLALAREMASQEPAA
jgi:amidase